MPTTSRNWDSTFLFVKASSQQKTDPEPASSNRTFATFRDSKWRKKQKKTHSFFVSVRLNFRKNTISAQTSKNVSHLLISQRGERAWLRRLAPISRDNRHRPPFYPRLLFINARHRRWICFLLISLSVSRWRPPVSLLSDSLCSSSRPITSDSKVRRYPPSPRRSSGPRIIGNSRETRQRVCVREREGKGGNAKSPSSIIARSFLRQFRRLAAGARLLPVFYGMNEDLHEDARRSLEFRAVLPIRDSTIGSKSYSARVFNFWRDVRKISFEISI